MVSMIGILSRRVRTMARTRPMRAASQGAPREVRAVRVLAPPSIRPKRAGDEAGEQEGKLVGTRIGLTGEQPGKAGRQRGHQPGVETEGSRESAADDLTDHGGNQ